MNVCLDGLADFLCDLVFAKVDFLASRKAAMPPIDCVEQSPMVGDIRDGAVLREALENVLFNGASGKVLKKPRSIFAHPTM